MTSRTVHVPAIHCQHCVATIGRELGELPGVAAARADAEAKSVTVEWDESRTTWDAIRALLVEIGFPPSGDASGA
jgi:copper chaperone